MTQTKSPSATTLVLRRTYDAPRTKVFDAWTNPDALKHENFRDSDQRDRHEHGWTAILEQLVAIIAKP